MIMLIFTKTADLQGVSCGQVLLLMKTVAGKPILRKLRKYSRRQRRWRASKQILIQKIAVDVLKIPRAKKDILEEDLVEWFRC
mmetsp:Transcript_9169/g.12350  ORF Transcript_9169/g.12350 Transcript_9169/m.12350 type:complete len:83 (-) Transcript_9169:106-354(-)